MEFAELPEVGEGNVGVRLATLCRTVVARRAKVEVTEEDADIKIGVEGFEKIGT